MSEPGVQRLKTYTYSPLTTNAGRLVPDGGTVMVRRNRTEAETRSQMERMFRNYGVVTDRMNRAYNRTVNAMIAKNRWGNL